MSCFFRPPDRYPAHVLLSTLLCLQKGESQRETQLSSQKIQVSSGLFPFSLFLLGLKKIPPVRIELLASKRKRGSVALSLRTQLLG